MRTRLLYSTNCLQMISFILSNANTTQFTQTLILNSTIYVVIVDLSTNESTRLTSVKWTISVVDTRQDESFLFTHLVEFWFVWDLVGHPEKLREIIINGNSRKQRSVYFVNRENYFNIKGHVYYFSPRIKPIEWTWYNITYTQGLF